MAKIPKDLRDRILTECGTENIVIATGSTIASGAIAFTIVLGILMRLDKNKEMK